MVMSSMKTSIIRSTISLKILSIHLWNVAGALHKLKDKLTFDDFLQGIENFGQHIQPLMACRSALLDAQQEVA